MYLSPLLIAGFISFSQGFALPQTIPTPTPQTQTITAPLQTSLIESTSPTATTTPPSAAVIFPGTTTKGGPISTNIPIYVPKGGQCGGDGWTGNTLCTPGTTCTYVNFWYSDCQ